METITLSVQTLETINRVLHDLIGYGDDRKVNFKVKLVKTEEDVVIQLDYVDTGKMIFKGTINEDNFIEAIISEDKKEKAERIKLNKN